MGIKDFYKFLKTKYPECFVYMDYSSFSYQKIAIDMMNLMYIYRSKSEKDWIAYVLRFMLKLRKQYIHPVCVFDGTSHPLKELTVKKRREEREKGKNRVERLRTDLDIYKTTFQVGDSLKELMRYKPELYEDSKPVPKKIEEYLEKLYKNYNLSFKYTDIELLKLLLSNLGLNVIVAENDAEAYCSYLSSSGQVCTILSNDSDVFFFGAKSVLFKFNEEGGFLITFDEILKKMELTREQFVDVCLLCGTDFNIPIKGYGLAKSLVMIKKFNSISNKEMPLYSQLDHELLEQIRDFTVCKEVCSKYSRPVDIKNMSIELFKNQIKLNPNELKIPYSQLEFI
jgi:5'-3' exonuclease